MPEISTGLVGAFCVRNLRRAILIWIPFRWITSPFRMFPQTMWIPRRFSQAPLRYARPLAAVPPPRIRGTGPPAFMAISGLSLGIGPTGSPRPLAFRSPPNEDAGLSTAIPQGARVGIRTPPHLNGSAPGLRELELRRMMNFADVTSCRLLLSLVPGRR